MTESHFIAPWQRLSFLIYLSYDAALTWFITGLDEQLDSVGEAVLRWQNNVDCYITINFTRTKKCWRLALILRNIIVYLQKPHTAWYRSPERRISCSPDTRSPISLNDAARWRPWWRPAPETRRCGGTPETGGPGHCWGLYYNLHAVIVHWYKSFASHESCYQLSYLRVYPEISGFLDWLSSHEISGFFEFSIKYSLHFKDL